MLEYTKYERSRTEHQMNDSIACYVVGKEEEFGVESKYLRVAY